MSTKMQKVRIAVAIDSNGHYNACGWWTGWDASGGTGCEAESGAFEGLDSEAAMQGLVWVEVEIPIPEALTVVAPGRLDDDVELLLAYADNYGKYRARVERWKAEGQSAPAPDEDVAAWQALELIGKRISSRLAAPVAVREVNE
jgi:hypothetical protein